MENFAVRVRRLRTEKRIYQREVAEFLGITVRAYQTYETGECEPNIARLIALADYFGVTVDYLVGRSDSRA